MSLLIIQNFTTPIAVAQKCSRPCLVEPNSTLLFRKGQRL